MYFATNVDAVLVVSHMYMYVLNIDMCPKRKEGWTKMFFATNMRVHKGFSV